MNTREAPVEIDLEQAVLGACLINNRLIDVAAAELEPEQFFDPLHRRLFQMIVHLSTEGAVTPIILRSVMKIDPGVKEIGPDYFFNLADAAPAMPDIPSMARLIREAAAKRELMQISEDTLADVLDGEPNATAQSIADRTTDKLLNLGRATAKPLLSPYEIALSSLKRVEDMAMGKPVPLIKTGLSKLDEEIGGLRGGDLVLVPAKSGMGKSALMGTAALNVARGLQDVREDLRRPPVPVIVFSLEMMREQWIERTVCDIDFDTAPKPMWYSRIRNGRMSSEEISRYGEAMQALHGLPLEIHDDDDLTIQQIGVRARAFKAKHGNAPLGLVVIDYAQIVSPIDPRAPREQQVAATARGAKALAKRLGWTVMLGSQVNEADAGRGKDEKRPQLSDTRESKSLGNEADIALSPFRPAYYVENRKPVEAVPGDAAWLAWKAELSACAHRMELLALKNRHGRRFDLELYCDMGASAIRDAAPYQSRTTPEQEADLLALAGQ